MHSYVPFRPLVKYMVMVQDTKYWTGGKAASASLPDDRVTAIFDGWGSVSNSAAAGIATRLDDLAGGGVKFLHFALLHMDRTKVGACESQATSSHQRTMHSPPPQPTHACLQLLGAGAFARVYRGTYRGQEVAIKLVYVAAKEVAHPPSINAFTPFTLCPTAACVCCSFCMELTREEVDDFASEAAMLASLAHRNVVHTYGVTVLPPSLAIVMEVCGRGSLYDCLHRATSPLDIMPRSGATTVTPRQLRLCLGAARGIAWLHNRGRVHRDIKSLNFLVTQDWTVKIADLGTMVMTSAAAAQAGADPTRGIMGTREVHTLRGASFAEDLSGHDLLRPGAASLATDDATSAPMADTLDPVARLRAESRARRPPRQRLGKPVEPATGTLEWVAPEVLRGAAFSEASDVYSLALVLYEILTCKLPFSTDHPDLFDMGVASFAPAV